MATLRRVIGGVFAGLGVALYAAIATWFAASSGRLVSGKLRWFGVGMSVLMYGAALNRFAFSRHLIGLRRRLGLSGFRIFKLMCAVHALAGGAFMVGALILLVEATNAGWRVLGILATLGALAWILLWSQILWGLWGEKDQPDVFDKV